MDHGCGVASYEPDASSARTNASSSDHSTGAWDKYLEQPKVDNGGKQWPQEQEKWGQPPKVDKGCGQWPQVEEEVVVQKPQSDEIWLDAEGEIKLYEKWEQIALQDMGTEKCSQANKDWQRDEKWRQHAHVDTGSIEWPQVDNGGDWEKGSEKQSHAISGWEQDMGTEQCSQVNKDWQRDEKWKQHAHVNTGSIEWPQEKGSEKQSRVISGWEQDIGTEQCSQVNKEWQRDEKWKQHAHVDTGSIEWPQVDNGGDREKGSEKQSHAISGWEQDMGTEQCSQVNKDWQRDEKWREHAHVDTGSIEWPQVDNGGNWEKGSEKQSHAISGWEQDMGQGQRPHNNKWREQQPHINKWREQRPHFNKWREQRPHFNKGWEQQPQINKEWGQQAHVAKGWEHDKRWGRRPHLNKGWEQDRGGKQYAYVDNQREQTKRWGQWQPVNKGWKQDRDSEQKADVETGWGQLPHVDKGCEQLEVSKEWGQQLHLNKRWEQDMGWGQQPQFNKGWEQNKGGKQQACVNNEWEQSQQWAQQPCANRGWGLDKEWKQNADVETGPGQWSNVDKGKGHQTDVDKGWKQQKHVNKERELCQPLQWQHVNSERGQLLDHKQVTEGSSQHSNDLQVGQTVMATENVDVVTKEEFNIKLVIDGNAKRVLYAEAGKEVIDLLFSFLTLPVASIIELITKKNMVGSMGNLYESAESISSTYIEPNLERRSLLKPTLVLSFGSVSLIPPNVSPRCAKYYRCSSTYHCFVTSLRGTQCPTCNCEMKTEMSYLAAGSSNASSMDVGYVKGWSTKYFVTDELCVMPMCTMSSKILSEKLNIADVSSIEEKIVNFRIEEGLEVLKAALQSKTVLTEVFLWKEMNPEMHCHLQSPQKIKEAQDTNMVSDSTSIVADKVLSIRILMDSQTRKVLFAEAEKELVDFLFSLLVLPVASITELINKENMVGSMGKLYESVENISSDYIQSNLDKNSLLKPKIVLPAGNIPLLPPKIKAQGAKYYMCSTSFRHTYVTCIPGTKCPSCTIGNYQMCTELYVTGGNSDASSSDVGCVEGGLKYLVTDELVIYPPTISRTALLEKYNVEGASLLEKTFDFGIEEGLQVLKAALQSETVLTEVFGKK